MHLAPEDVFIEDIVCLVKVEDYIQLTHLDGKIKASLLIIIHC